jgi:biotin carboxyl carrier protein
VALELRAEMAASVWQVLVAPGDVVAEGDVLLILESMKMELPVEAPAGGVVADLAVAEGDAVQEGDLLVAIEDQT